MLLNGAKIYYEEYGKGNRCYWFTEMR
jgi:hypothetical protein